MRLIYLLKPGLLAVASIAQWSNHFPGLIPPHEIDFFYTDKPNAFVTRWQPISCPVHLYLFDSNFFMSVQQCSRCDFLFRFYSAAVLHRMKSPKIVLLSCKLKFWDAYADTNWWCKKNYKPFLIPQSFHLVTDHPSRSQRDSRILITPL